MENFSESELREAFAQILTESEAQRAAEKFAWPLSDADAEAFRSQGINPATVCLMLSDEILALLYFVSPEFKARVIAYRGGEHTEVEQPWRDVLRRTQEEIAEARGLRYSAS